MKKIFFLLIITICIINRTYTFAQTPIGATVQINTQVQTNPPSIGFSWTKITGATGIQIYRKTKESDNWDTLLAVLSGTATSFKDTNVSVGKDYEYKILSLGTQNAYTYVYSGINFPAVEYRGKVILIIDSTFKNSLATELHTLELDLIGDGWQVIRHDVSRNDTLLQIKSLIKGDYISDSINVKAVFLFGHVAVPYSGDIAPDGHTPYHLGAWPADGYYADIWSTWTDTYINDATADFEDNWNIPGDGKFDQSILNATGLKLQVGRVDLSNMPSFSKTEEELLRQYLNKAHSYKQKVFTAVRRGLIDDCFGWYYGDSFASSGWRNFTAMFPPSNIMSANYFFNTANQSYLWGYGCGPGTFTTCDGIGSTSSFTAKSPKCVFNMFLGSYFGDWNTQDNFLRAPLASSGWGLTCSWSGRPYSIFHHMALGETAGYSMLRTMQNGYTYDSGTGFGVQYVSNGLMGDPTLRMHTVAPPENVYNISSFSKITIRWLASADTVLGYHIYRQDSITGKYIRINDTIVTGTIFMDATPLYHVNHYMIRAIKLETSNSGTYYNLSQGIFDTAITNTGAGLPITMENYHFRIFPNPTKENVNVEFNINDDSEVKVELFDIRGSTVRTIVQSNLSNGSYKFTLETSDLSNGVYICCFKVKDKTIYKKLVVSR